MLPRQAEKEEPFTCRNPALMNRKPLLIEHSWHLQPAVIGSKAGCPDHIAKGSLASIGKGSGGAEAGDRPLCNAKLPGFLQMLKLLPVAEDGIGPVVNPVVLSSTYTAFALQPDMAMYRAVAALIVALLVGVLVLLFVKQNPLRLGTESQIRHEASHLAETRGKLSATFSHAVDEFFDMGKFLLFGALVSAMLQVFVSRDTLLGIGQTPLTSHLVMMGMAYILRSLILTGFVFLLAELILTQRLSHYLAPGCTC